MLEVPLKLKPFASHGIDFTYDGGANMRGTCCFCGADDHFFAHKESTQWDCKQCGEVGNVVSFLEKIWRLHLNETTITHYRKLGQDRGLPIRALKRFRLAWNGSKWLVPITSPKGSIRDLRHWSYATKRVMSTAGCKLELFGLPRLSEVKPNECVLWLVEGEWDTMAMSELLVIAGKKGDVVIGAPGANTFKAEWLEYFKGHHVRICYDNDDAGDNGGMKAGKMLRGVAKKIEYLCWPDNLPTGYDVRDFVISALAADDSGVEALRKFDVFFFARHRRDKTGETESEADEGRDSFEVIPQEERPAFTTIRDTLMEHMYFDDEIEMALKVTLAVMISESLPHSPLWLQLVAPPGGGKTMLLTLGSTSERVVFRSSITPKSLVSGYKEGVRPDPSLLRYLTDRTLVIKDGTEILSLPAVQQEEIWSIFRGAYDGSLMRNYGNGVTRDYKELHFSVLMGVTPIIEAHNKAALGDRFLRLYMRTKDESELDKRIDAAIETLYADAEVENSGKELVSKFLSREPLVPIRLPDWGLAKVKALSKLVSALRVSVCRDTYDRQNLLSRPQEEIGTRLAQQLAKLAISIAHVEGKTEVDVGVFKIVERVALDTAIGLYLEVVTVMARDMERGWTKTEMSTETSMPYTTVERRIDDLHQARVLIRRKRPASLGKRGAPGIEYLLSDTVRDRWRKAVNPAGLAIGKGRLRIWPKKGRKRGATRLSQAGRGSARGSALASRRGALIAFYDRRM